MSEEKNWNNEPPLVINVGDEIQVVSDVTVLPSEITITGPRDIVLSGRHGQARPDSEAVLIGDEAGIQLDDFSVPTAISEMPGGDPP